MRQERLYLFQFPAPFPEFVPNAVEPEADIAGSATDTASRRVKFAADVKPEADPSSAPPAAAGVPAESKLDGNIGNLEIYASGAVKMRLHNGILLDVSVVSIIRFTC